MKKSTNSLFTTLSDSHLESLTNQLHETVALVCIQNSRIFTSADLWNIQRQTKKRMQRRFF